jgi:drug/metabolite transporter (DMT)-like permease
VTIIKVSGMVLAVAGVSVIVGNGAAAPSPHRLAGDLLLISGGVMWTACNIAVRRLGSIYSALTTTYYQTCAGAAGFLLLAPIEHSRWHLPPAHDVFLLVYLVLFCSILAFIFYNAGLRHLSSATAVNLLNLVPVSGLAFAVLLAGETVSITQILGGLIVIAGVILGLNEVQPRKAGGQDTEEHLQQDSTRPEMSTGDDCQG